MELINLLESGSAYKACCVFTLSQFHNDIFFGTALPAKVSFFRPTWTFQNIAFERGLAIFQTWPTDLDMASFQPTGML